jgi:hypothetical protein
MSTFEESPQLRGLVAQSIHSRREGHVALNHRGLKAGRENVLKSFSRSVAFNGENVEMFVGNFGDHRQ